MSPILDPTRGGVTREPGGDVSAGPVSIWPIGDDGGTRLPATTDESKAQFLDTALNAGIALAYGRHLVGGTVILYHYDAVAKITYLFVALGEGEWDGIENLWIDTVLEDETDTDLVHFHPGFDGVAGTETVPGTPNQQVCSFFPATLTGLTFSRTAYIALAIPDDPASTTTGDKVDVRGIYRCRKVRIFDAAGAETSFAYSANPAWCLLDAFISLYLKPHGAVDEALTTAEKARIDFVAFHDAADYCDADIGGGIARFEAHVFFKENTSLQKIFETFCATCRGYLREHEGKLALYIDQPRASIFTFDTDNIVDASFETSAPDLRSTTNRLVVKIRDLESGGADHSKDFAPFTKTLDAEWHQTQVGRIIKQEIDLGANTKERTERLGAYWLNRSLLEKKAQFTATQDAGAVMPGDRVLGPIDHAMVSTGDWEVIEVTDEPDGSRRISLQEYDADIFSDVAGPQQDAEETNIPATTQRTWIGIDVTDAMVLASEVAITIPDGTSVDLYTTECEWRAHAEGGDGSVGPMSEGGGALYIQTDASAGAISLRIFDPCIDPAAAKEALFHSITQLPDPSTVSHIVIGLGLLVGGEEILSFTEAIYVTRSAGHWATVTKDSIGPGSEVQASTLDVTNGLREWLIERDANGVNFYTRVLSTHPWTLLHTHLTHIPTSKLYPIFYVDNDAAGQARLNIMHCRFASK